MTEEDMNEFNDWQDKQDEEAHELQKNLRRVNYNGTR